MKAAYMIFRFCRNNISGHVYLFLVVLLIFKVGRSNLNGHVHVFHVVMAYYTSICQHKKTRPCKHYRNILGSSVIVCTVLWVKLIIHIHMHCLCKIVL